MTDKHPTPRRFSNTVIKWTFYSVAIVVLSAMSIACHLMTDTPGMSSTFYLVAAIFGVIVCVCEVVGIYLTPFKNDDNDD